MQRKIALCPGHSAVAFGVGKNGFREHEVCSHITSQLERVLSEFEVRVIEGTLLEKTTAINSYSPNIALEIHTGNCNKSQTSGSRTFYDIKKPTSEFLSECVLTEMVRTLNTRNQGSRAGWYKKISPKTVKDGRAPEGWKPKIDLFLKKVTCPAVLVEPFFLSSPNDVKKFILGRKLGFVAHSIANGIRRYFHDLDTFLTDSLADEFQLSNACCIDAGECEDLPSDPARCTELEMA